MNRSLNPTPLVVSAEEALQNVETYLRAVRALCRADISIVDVSAYNPGIMMLLGIRAAVRRGITIASTECELNAETWSQVPFNLKELNLLSHRPGNARRYEELTESILEALDQRERSSLYQDLPVYDYVRDLGNDYEDYEPVRKDERVLFLRPFGESYQTNSWGFIRQRFQAILQRQKLTPKLESIVDENSPRLVGQRLYDAIRRTDVCVVDFTDWRANVFFELGVRLAVREIGPLCIVDIDRIEETTAIKQHLIALLEPFQYRLAGPETPFRNALNAFEKMQQADPLSYHPNGASLAHDQTYHIASRYFVEDQDRFSMSVEQSLMAAVTAAVGRGDDLQNVNSTQLYGSENEILARRLRDGLLEHLCAAWYYLDGREAPASFDMIDLLNSKKRAVFQDYRTIMGRLEIRLSERVKPRDKHLKAVLEDRKKSMVDRNLFKLDDGLNDWESLWQEVRQVLFSEERELDEAREVGEEYLEVANQLRSMLENLGDVVCQAFLEKIDTSCRMVQNQLNALLS
jgi:hypothetical protein